MADLHDDARRFREAVEHTASSRRFLPLLVEKDYYCSAVLAHLDAAFHRGLVFKGGTSLCKVHTDFCRLSEDLDFVIPTETTAARSRRRQLSQPIKACVEALPDALPHFRLSGPMQVFNEHRQYQAVVWYRSVLTSVDQSIKVEISLREPALDPVEWQLARTLLTDPFRDQPAVAPISVQTLSVRETYAEKVRAALTRREPAIRDFFDIDYAICAGRLDTADPRFMELIRHKLAVPRNDPVDASEARLAALQEQIAGQLKPVLRTEDFVRFNLDRAFRTVKALANGL